MTQPLASNTIYVYYNESAIGGKAGTLPQDLSRAFAKRGYEMVLRTVPDEYAKLSLDGLDPEHMTTLVEMTENDIASIPLACLNRSRISAIGEIYESAGIPCLNSSVLTKIANDKLATYELALELGLATPKMQRLDLAIKSDVPETGFPSVVKTRDGHGGTEVWWVEDEVAFSDMVQSGLFDAEAAWRYIIQAAVDEPGTDMRVYVIGDEIFMANRRHSDSDFKANVTLGGKSELLVPDEIPAEVTKGCARLIEHMGFDFAGIDFMRDKGHWVLNEIEDPVGVRAFNDTSIDMAKVFCERVVEKIEEQ